MAEGGRREGGREGGRREEGGREGGREGGSGNRIPQHPWIETEGIHLLTIELH